MAIFAARLLALVASVLIPLDAIVVHIPVASIYAQPE
jgi:hypothetical protein